MKIIKNTSKFDSKKLRSLFCFVHTLIAKDLRIGRLKHWDTLKIGPHTALDPDEKAELKETMKTGEDTYDL